MALDATTKREHGQRGSSSLPCVWRNNRIQGAQKALSIATTLCEDEVIIGLWSEPFQMVWLLTEGRGWPSHRHRCAITLLSYENDSRMCFGKHQPKSNFQPHKATLRKWTRVTSTSAPASLTGVRITEACWESLQNTMQSQWLDLIIKFA